MIPSPNDNIAIDCYTWNIDTYSSYDNLYKYNFEYRPYCFVFTYSQTHWTTLTWSS